MGEPAIVLRTRVYRDYDVIVDLIAQDAGRISAIARGARKSRRRFGAALTIGAILDVELARRGGAGLYTLKSCDIQSLPKNAASELARFYQLAYVLEIVAGVCVEGPTEELSLRHLATYLGLLERVMPSHEQLCVWELRLMAIHGYQLQFWPCVLSGQKPDAFSLTAGGAVRRDACLQNDAGPVPTPVLRRYHDLCNRHDVRLTDTEHEWLRTLMGRAWFNILGRPLKSSEFLGPDTFGPPIEAGDVSESNSRSTETELC